MYVLLIINCWHKESSSSKYGHSTKKMKSEVFLYLFVCWLVCWLVCQQVCTKTTEHLSKKLGWHMGLWSESIRLNFSCGSR